MQKRKKSKLELQQMMTDKLAAEGYTGISLRIRGTHSGKWAVEILDGGAELKDEIAEAAGQLLALYGLAE
jgi:hypothetical protein